MDFCLYFSITYERNLLKITISISGFSLFTLPFVTCFRSFEIMFLGIEIGFRKHEFGFCFCFVPNSVYLSYFTCIFVIFALSVIIDRIYFVSTSVFVSYLDHLICTPLKKKKKKDNFFPIFLWTDKDILLIYLFINFYQPHKHSIPFLSGLNHFFGEVAFSFLVVPLKIMCLYSLHDLAFFTLGFLLWYFQVRLSFCLPFLMFMIILASASWSFISVFQNRWWLSFQELLFYHSLKPIFLRLPSFMKILKFCFIWLFFSFLCFYPFCFPASVWQWLYFSLWTLSLSLIRLLFSLIIFLFWDIFS